MDLLIRSIGLEPGALDDRAKGVVLLRMVAFVERNYNLVELGPRDPATFCTSLLHS
jgi:ATP-dependent Lon protease